MRHISDVLEAALMDALLNEGTAGGAKLNAGTPAAKPGEESGVASILRHREGTARQNGNFETDRDALDEVASPRPGQPAFLPTNRVDANRSMVTVFRRRPAKNRPRGSAVIIDLSVYRAQRHAALLSNTGVSIRAKNS